MRTVAKPVKAVALFWPDRRPRPYKFKIPDSNGEEVTVTVDNVLGYKYSRIAGIECIIFECRSTFGNIKRRYQMKYLIKECKWELFKIYD